MKTLFHFNFCSNTDSSIADNSQYLYLNQGDHYFITYVGVCGVIYQQLSARKQGNLNNLSDV